MTHEQRRAATDQYAAGYDVVRAAVAGASPAELDARPAPGKWSSREIVHHLADSEMIAAVRLRRLIAEDAPVIHPYDQEEYARRLHYDRPIETSLELLRISRLRTVELLNRLTAGEWAREGTHSEHGAYPVDKWLTIYATHAHNHANQIRAARKSAGH